MAGGKASKVTKFAGKEMGKGIGRLVDRIYYPELYEEPNYGMVQRGWEIRDVKFDDEGNPYDVSIAPKYKRVRLSPPPKRPEEVLIPGMSLEDYLLKRGKFAYRRDENNPYPKGWKK